MFGTSALTIYVLKEPFKGDLDELIAREVKQLQADGGGLDEALSNKNFVFVGNQIKQNYGYNLWRSIPGKTFFLKKLIVHKGHAYRFGCETPDPNDTGFARVGGYCSVRGSTFNVEPGEVLLKR